MELKIIFGNEKKVKPIFALTIQRIDQTVYLYVAKDKRSERRYKYLYSYECSIDTCTILKIFNLKVDVQPQVFP